MLKIGNKVKQEPNPTNKYKLVVSNMSGDADAYHDSVTFLNKEDEPLIEEIVELCNWSQKSWPRRDAIEDKYNELIRKYSDLDVDEPIVTRDVTTDGDSICRPSISSISWFDEKVIEYNVNYK